MTTKRRCSCILRPASFVRWTVFEDQLAESQDGRKEPSGPGVGAPGYPPGQQYDPFDDLSGQRQVGRLRARNYRLSGR